MTWFQAEQYCTWREARLPTEAEWEFACKAGTDTAYSFGNDSEELSNHSWHLGNSRFKYQKVAQKSPTPLGLYDMHGNVFEWTADFYGSYELNLVVNPVGSSNGASRVFRGGSLNNSNYFLGQLKDSISLNLTEVKLRGSVSLT